MRIETIAKRIHKTALEKGWWDEQVVGGRIIPRSLGDQFANFHAEISEAWEEFRNGHQLNEIYYNGNKPEGVPIELADCIIRILDSCAAYGIDIEAAIMIKMGYNITRPHRHGGKKA